MNILLVDDHTLFREALRGFLVEGLDCCRFMQASSPEEAFDVVANCGDLDLILLVSFGRLVQVVTDLHSHYVKERKKEN